MSCCAPGVEAAAALGQPASPDELRLASRDLGNGVMQTDLSVPSMHCGACIRTVETTLARLEGVVSARVNLSTRRAAVKWSGQTPPEMIASLANAGFAAHLAEPADTAADPQMQRLIRALAVSGFCAMNIMMLSVSVWSGAGEETRFAFHLVSAALALPCLIYAGGIFYQSAWQALRHGRTNMDVPISVGITLAYGLSLYDTVTNGHHAYFDAATTLIFFLLIGRTLDHMMRDRARSSVRALARLSPRGATVLSPGGGRDYIPVSDIEPGMTLLVFAGDRVPVDGQVIDGRSDVDTAIATGESLPVTAGAGDKLLAGALNLTGPLTLRASARAQDSFLAEMTRLMEAAEGGRARYRRIADRAAALYSPVVHLTALVTLISWIAITGDWHRAISVAIAVLIITCPCALGLAVPIVQVVAARRLFETGVMMKDGAALEKLAEIDTVVFDKTGTLTTGRPALRTPLGDEAGLSIAAALAQNSRHPLSRAIAESLGNHSDIEVRLTGISEIPGLGVEAEADGATCRLGRASWALGQPGETGTVLSRNGRLVSRFDFTETLRPGAAEAMTQLAGRKLNIELLSGDHRSAVETVARQTGIQRYSFGLLPDQKVARLTELAQAGHKPMMVGDGLNDAPALAAAHASMAPSTAADIGRNAADFVFLRDDLGAVPAVFRVALRARDLVRQNFAIAIAYNALALPVAMLGYVTPLIAALAMSGSSIIVVANALRMPGEERPLKPVTPARRGLAKESSVELVAAE